MKDARDALEARNTFNKRVYDEGLAGARAFVAAVEQRAFEAESALAEQTARAEGLVAALRKFVTCAEGKADWRMSPIREEVLEVGRAALAAQPTAEAEEQ